MLEFIYATRWQQVQAGRFQFAMQPGQHLHVNGEAVATAAEVAAAIESSVFSALRDLGDALR